MEISDKDLLAMYRWMVLDRIFEEKTFDLLKMGKLVGFHHPNVGQEAVDVGTCYGLRKDDTIMPTHRGKGKYLMKGVDMKTMMAGMFGRRNGSGKGRGPASHSGDNSIGLLAGTGLIGSGIPISTGAALAMKLQKKDSVAIHFFGDGASNRGDCHESLNIAGVMKLPIIYVLDNNCYAMSVAQSCASAVQDLSVRAAGYGFPGVTVDGNDLLGVYAATQAAIARARRGEGPTLIECKTYRWFGHSINDPAVYRSADEVEGWKKKCPVKRYEAYLAQRGLLNEAKIGEVRKGVIDEIEDAIRFAESSPQPRPEDALLGVYAE
ncbi:MAG TPA: thiamine pyrophosphate-dependent dehydrogenase E1 component subunit alpha [Thermodesulfobacteriota bacterium]|nr:thiamine pyrophosphate-dependent dehydrogenase E1 component subunit alpha [Thermodesulfobacteriota bacterium]